MKNFLKQLAVPFGKMLKSLSHDIQNFDRFRLMLLRNGWDLNEEYNISVIYDAFDIVRETEDLVQVLNEYEFGTQPNELEAILNLVNTAKRIYQSIRELENKIDDSLPFPLNKNEFWKEFSESFFANSFSKYLEKNSTTSFSILHFLDIIQFERITPVEKYRVPYTRTKINWDGLIDFLTKPDSHISKLYSWNDDEKPFNHDKLIRVLERIALAFYVPALVSPPRKYLQEKFYNGNSPIYSSIYELEIPLISGSTVSGRTYQNIGISLSPIQTTSKSDEAPSGMAIMPLFEGAASKRFYLGSKDIYLNIRGAFNSENFIIKILPDDFSIVSNWSNDTIDTAIEIIAKPEKPFLIFGDRDSSRLELDGFNLGVALKGALSDPEFQAYVKLKGQKEDSLFNSGFKGVIDLGYGDSFIQNSVNKKKLEFGFNLDIIYSNISGFTFGTQANIDLCFPAHIPIGPIEITKIYFSILGNTSNEKKEIIGQLGVGLNIRIKPILFSFENLGLELRVIPLEENKTGNFGNLDFNFNFKPPSQLGIILETDSISGGGFLHFDHTNHRYTGALTIQFEKLELSAIGIITTKLPNGEKGFSMLVSINVLFTPPIELGLKFQLVGVGGFIGINRTMRLDDLRNRFLSGAIKDMMFPENPLQNVNQILSDLEGVFPTEEGNHVIAPFVQLAWGTSSIVQAYLGLFIEFPFTGRVIVLGRVEVALPTAQSAMIAINIGIEGDFNFAQRYILIKGLIEENTSHIVDYPIKGGFAFMFDWGNRPRFALSVGGFHPGYTPPKGFPSLPRLSIDMSNGDNVQIYGTFFQALTSNTVQIGVVVDVYIKTGPFSIDADFSFEALIQFNPFYFIFSLSLSIDVKWRKWRLFGAALDFDFSGPTPYRVKGYAQLKFGPFSKKIDFDKSWGKDKQDYIPAIDPTPLLIAELDAKENWGSVLPDKRELGANLKVLEVIGDTLDYILVHPSGKLEIQQNIVPFNKLIETIGNAPVTKVQTYRLANFKIGSTSLSANSENIIPSQAFFSRAHFEHFDLEESEEKLALPDFELMEAGVKFGSDELQSYGEGETVNQIAYEDIIINKDLTAERKLNLGTVLSRNGRTLAKAAAAKAFFENPIDRIEIPTQTNPNFSIPATFKVVGVDALDQFNAADSFFSYADASDALKHRLKNQPNLKDTHQIMSKAAYELA